VFTDYGHSAQPTDAEVHRQSFLFTRFPQMQFSASCCFSALFNQKKRRVVFPIEVYVAVAGTCGCQKQQKGLRVEQLFREEFVSDFAPRLLVPVLYQQLTSHSISWI
jgi:hypothetical protein